jgi:hypothetical protein
MEHAAQLGGAAAALRDASSARAHWSDRTLVDPVLTAVQDTLGMDAFAAAWSAGRSIGLEAVVDMTEEKMREAARRCEASSKTSCSASSL